MVWILFDTLHHFEEQRQNIKYDHLFYVIEDYNINKRQHRVKVWNLPPQAIIILLMLHCTEPCQTLNNVLAIVIF